MCFSTMYEFIICLEISKKKKKIIYIISNKLQI